MAEQIIVDIDFDNRTAKVKLDDLQKSIDNTAKKSGQSFTKNFESSVSNSVDRVSKRFLALGATALAATGAFLFGRKSIEGAIDAEDAINTFNSALQRTGTFTEENSKKFLAFADGIEATTKVTTEAVLRSSAVIQSIGRLQNEELQKATSAALDLSQALGIDLTSASNTIAKAAVGSTSALSRYGIVIDDSIPKSERFAAALDEIQRRFGGAAAQEAQTFSGLIAQTGNLLGSTAKEFGLFVVDSDAVKDSLKVVNTELFNFNQEISKTRDESGDIFKEIIPPLARLGSLLSEYLLQPLELIIRVLNILRLGLADFFQDFSIAIIDLFLDKINSIPDVLIAVFERLGVNFGTVKDTLTDIRDTAVDAGVIIKENLDNAFTNFTDETFSQRIAANFEKIAIAAENSAKRKAVAAKKGAEETRKSTQTEILSMGFLQSQIVNSTQALVKGLREGQDAGQVFQNILLDVAANIATQVGQTLIGVGLGVDALKASLVGFSGGQVIAAGIALVALGALLKSFSGGSATAGTAIGGVGGSGGATPVQDITPDEIEEREPRTLVNLTVNGDILDSQDTPRRLARLLNASFKEEGTRILSGI